VAGSPEQCAAKIREYEAAGLSQFILDFQQHGVASPASSMEQMALFRELVVPLL
jgi:alkanesulfonate monooxygenase SsuD/methylene tetrahydromethanopterin reductase-like flavin-dependent oxidoreductase (luciferase family)